MDSSMVSRPILALSGKESQGMGSLLARSLIDAVPQTLVWLPVTGAVLALFCVHVPQGLELWFDLIGKVTAGGALFTLGLMLCQQLCHRGHDLNARQHGRLHSNHHYCNRPDRGPRLSASPGKLENPTANRSPACCRRRVAAYPVIYWHYVVR